MFTQHKYEALNSKGRVIGSVWAANYEQAIDIADHRWEGKCTNVRVTRIKKRAPIYSHRTGYKDDFYGRKGAFAHV